MANFTKFLTKIFDRRDATAPSLNVLKGNSNDKNFGKANETVCELQAGKNRYHSKSIKR